MEEINITKELEAFRRHVLKNKRVVLSSAFGDGKSYFLKKFEDNNKGNGNPEDNFFVVTIRPVNYVVADNKDIFEYIKFDILTQLEKSGNVPDFDADSFVDSLKDNLLTLHNLDMAADFLLDFVPGGGVAKRVKDSIIKIVGAGKDINDKYDEKKKTYGKYKSIMESQIGSIYERDGYTLLIKGVLSAIRSKKILVIEDLDRLDPKHLFRLLNIFSAHIDQDTENNKFGFDSIIFVMDYNVTEKIFHHFYGADANYKGYMGKFHTGGIFWYSIRQAAKARLKEYIEAECKYTGPDNISITPTATLAQIIDDISVRDVAKILDNKEHTYDDVIITCGRKRIKTDQGIVKFIALLKQFPIAINPDFILNKLTDNPCIMNMMGSFLLDNEDYQDLRFDFNERTSLRSVFGDGTAYASLKFVETSHVDFLYDINPDIRRTFREAIKYVV